MHVPIESLAPFLFFFWILYSKSFFPGLWSIKSIYFNSCFFVLFLFFLKCSYDTCVMKTLPYNFISYIILIIITGTSHYKTFNQRLTKRASPITSSMLTEDNVFIISSFWPICSYLEASYSETLFSGFTHRKVCCESERLLGHLMQALLLCWVETIILRN